MELRLLGTVRAVVNGHEASLGGRQQRLVLALLALHVNQPVAVSRMVDWIWPDPPRRAEHAVRVHISQLRSALNDAAEIVAQGPAYVLRTDPSSIDAHRFQHLVTQSQDADDEARISLLEEALALWEGPALADVADPELRERLCGGLEEQRLLAVEDRYDAMLRLGRGRNLIHELTEYVNQHPTRERPVGQLMLALYRDRQQAVALEVFRRTREMLAEELGIDPGPELRRLELAILRNDPALDPAVVRLDVPALLPPGVADFVGRDEQLRRLDEAMAAAGTVVINAIAGTGGVGKTALALHWAHRARSRFPDGQLYVNLNGFAVGPPLRPEQALFQFLRALGVPAEQIPADLAEASGMYRTVLAERRMLVVLDNAATAEQVRPLLPAGPTCAVLVTSRNRLDGLVAINAARRIIVEVLPPEEAVDLLARILGRERVAAEPEAAAELARTAAYLPLALRIAATSLSNHPRRRIADYLTELHSVGVLDALELDETVAVRSTFALSYGTLKPEVQRVFRLMGLVPGPDVSVEAMAAMADLPVARTRSLLDHLATTNLVDQPSYGRCTFHDLLREYARETAEDIDAGSDRRAALDRLFLHYRRLALATSELVYPGVVRLTRSTDLPDPVTFEEPDRALAWLDAERQNLVAVVEHAERHGRWRVAWELGDTLRAYLSKKALRAEWRIVAAAALAAAEADGDPRAIGSAHFNLATLAVNHHDEALAHFRIALRRYEETGWLHGQAAVHTYLGGMAEDLGRLDAAVEHQRQALGLARRGGLRHMLGTGLLNLAMTNLIRNDVAEAGEHAAEALALAREHESPDLTGHASYALGLVASLQGRHDEAKRLCRQAVDIFERIQAASDVSASLSHLCFVLIASGDHVAALAAAREAVALAEQLHGRLQVLAWNSLADARAALGEDASDDRRRALDLAREIVARYEECRALIGLGEHAAALDLARRHGFRLVGRHVLDLSPGGQKQY